MEGNKTFFRIGDTIINLQNVDFIRFAEPQDGLVNVSVYFEGYRAAASLPSGIASGIRRFDIPESQVEVIQNQLVQFHIETPQKH